MIVRRVSTNRCITGTVALVLALACAFAFQTPPAATATVDRVADPFATGWMLADTNGDGIADFISRKVVVPTSGRRRKRGGSGYRRAARLRSTGLTMPLGVMSDANLGTAPRIQVQKTPYSSRDLATIAALLEKQEGGVFLVEGNPAAGTAGEGLLAAAEVYSARRAPYQPSSPG